MKTFLGWIVSGSPARMAVPLVIAATLLMGCSTTASNAVVSNAASSPAELHEHSALQTGTAELKVPAALAAEHKELHEQLAAAISSGGKTGEAAKVVEEHLSNHFKGEEEYALPQLGLLGPLAEGEMPADAARAIALSHKLKTEMPKMLEEHKGIVAALDKLAAAGREEKKEQAVQFAERLRAHAGNEEQITYPAAILVGEYLTLKGK